MRSFVAIELPPALRAEVGRRVDELRRDLPPARWVPVENLHLTLVFLGEIAPSREAPLAARLGIVFRRSAAFDLQLEGAGCFPRRRPARVVWVGVAPEPALLDLQREVARVCGEELAREPESRAYHAHLTVARCRRPWPAGPVRRWCDGMAGRLGASFAVREGVLMESRLSADGARYRPRARMPLAEGR